MEGLGIVFDDFSDVGGSVNLVGEFYSIESDTRARFGRCWTKVVRCWYESC